LRARSAEKKPDRAGAGLFKTNEIERLYRDVRAGGIHPANAALVHEIVGKTALGVLGEPGPRWG
jgi:alkylation response protein AidB-like acyl-CoA dehydrogenase